MAVILPPQAANLAKDIYNLVDKNQTQSEVVFGFEEKYSGILDLSSNNVVSARTGGPSFIKIETAFGLMAYGVGGAKNSAFIILRGTKILADLLTDFNAMWSSTSVQGYKIHDGFSQAFKALRPQLEVFVAGFAARGITEVHCIGHSLGGALATLCAEYVGAKTGCETYLYTFGSPRVGLTSFAQNLSERLEGQGDKQAKEQLKRVFRVHHKTDIVSCFPPWPYSHVPFVRGSQNDYFQPSPGFMPLLAWHDMDKYKETFNRKTWPDLRGKRFEP